MINNDREIALQCINEAVAAIRKIKSGLFPPALWIRIGMVFGEAAATLMR